MSAKLQRNFVMILVAIVCSLSQLVATGRGERALGSGESPYMTDNPLSLITTESDVMESNTPPNSPTENYVIGNLEVETQDSGTPSSDTGLYLLSQEVPYDGRVKTLRACGFLIGQNPNPQGTDQITLFFFVTAYRRTGDSYIRLYDSYVFAYDINDTDIFGCDEENVIDEGWTLSRGDRIGVIVQQADCVQFAPTTFACPAHVNVIDPVKNCSQAHYFPNTARVLGNNVPDKISVFDGDPVDTFINLDAIIEADPPRKPGIPTRMCAMSARTLPPGTMPPRTMAVVIAVSVIVLVGALLIIVLTASIVVYCHTASRRRTNQPKVHGHGTVSIRSDLNLQPCHNARYHQVDQPDRDSGTVNPLVTINDVGSSHTCTGSYVINSLGPSEDDNLCDIRASICTGSYVINCLGFSEDDNTCEELYCDPAGCEKDLKQQLKNLEVKEVFIENIELKEYLGSGHFGVVYRGLLQYTGANSGRGFKEVAIKTTKSGACEEERIKFLQEAATMGQFNNPYVLKIFGVLTSSNPYMIICELMSKGDLRRYLHTIRTSGTLDSNKVGEMLLNYSRQVAGAMVYLSVKGYVHCDLAARNILVSVDGICKVSDFGLSKDLQDEDYYVAHSGLVPLRWAAPEALQHSKYSTASDVWSFGIVLYEIWSLASKPYATLANKQVLHQVLNGYRLPSPAGCPRAVYGTMISCWHPESVCRPTFSELKVSLQQPDIVLLEWSEEDRATYSENARTIGASLHRGETLHSDLQKVYEAHSSTHS